MQKNSEKNENNDVKVNEDILAKISQNEAVDLIYGFEDFKGDKEKTGWLVNMKSTDFVNLENNAVSAMVYYFLEEDGSRFKAIKVFQPYFYVCTKKGTETAVENELRKKYNSLLTNIEQISKEDLDLDNHLSGIKRNLIKLTFGRSEDLLAVRRELLPAIKENRKKDKEESNYTTLLTEHYTGYQVENRGMSKEWINWIVDIREYDVPYHIRVSIDLDIFIGKWYTVVGNGEFTEIKCRDDLVHRPDPIVLAYDIETTKSPLKFPDSSVDQIMMISYMLDAQGYLICNREIISEDVEDFEFTPRPEFPGPFVVFNEADEKATILRFFEHICDVKPHLFVSYNGDFFDWPFVEARAFVHGIDMFKEIGFYKDSQGEYKCRAAAHMDALQWVKRDSYLPVGSQGLKPVCKAKLRYDPVEVDPEEMVKFAREQPRKLANYSVSDAVATYYLYMRYVHPFIFALCTIIPMDPDEVLRKGSGTLCESLLMVEAFRANIIFPNKQETKLNELTPDGHLLKSETYVGGHVEALESGVFRADVDTKFRIVPEMCQYLRDNLKNTLEHALVVEEKVSMDIITNFEEVVNQVDDQLKDLQENPNRFERPLIYHLDVAAMYPNIILSNRLQPSAVFGDVDSRLNQSQFRCKACSHNVAGAQCQRRMQWVWRAEVMPADRGQYYLIQSQLEREKFPNKFNPQVGPPRAWYQLSQEEQAEAVSKRVEKLCQNMYKRRHDTRLETRTSIVCQKENSFYVDTVRAFRDRRYEFKGLVKQWKGKLDNLLANNGDATEVKHANGMLVLYDSLQLAHKCILNSFYGYVMRRGARWYSMEMAGIVCHTGANIIRKAREVIEQVGRPLELDTDGVWCILPASFPETIKFTTTNPKKPKVTVSYPGAMLNIMVQSDFKNDQYHDLVNPETRQYSIRSENSIFFEVDGPYQAMILPAAKEQGKKLKKRYAVFNFDGSLAELKGFEVKRNGELNLIKIFQSNVFESFLKGNTLEEIYGSVAEVANYWLDLLFTKAEHMEDDELFELISERKVMSKKLEEYGGQKSTSISTAKRLAEFLGDEMVRDSGLSFKFVISKKPQGLTVTERAVPTAIFQAEQSVKEHYLKKWLKCPELESFDIRDILDWNYYIERFSSNIQKIITIPAALQKVANPIPRVPHPDWLQKRLLENDDPFKQRRIDEMFSVVSKEEAEARKNKELASVDIEDMASKKETKEISRKRTKIGSKLGGKNGDTVDEDTLPDHWRDVLGDPPSRGYTETQWKAWLKFHQRKWALQKSIRDKHMKESQGQSSSTTNEPKRKMSRLGNPANTLRQANISSFVSQSRVSLVKDTWQIVQLQETVTPGIFNAWVVLGSCLLLKVKLDVPRIFYVNTRIGKGDGSYYKRVRKSLPRSRPVQFLYEYVLPETTYVANESSIRAEFVKNEVEGIYELSVPLMFRALMRLGCLCVVDRSQDSHSSSDNNIFSLTQLRQRSTAQTSYLSILDEENDSKSSQNLNQIFLFQYKIQANSRNGVISVFIPSQSKSIICITGVSQVAGNIPSSKQALSMLQKERTDMYESVRESEESSSITRHAAGIESVEVYADNLEENAMKRINKALLLYKQECKTPTLLVSVTKTKLQDLVGSKGTLGVLTEFPQIPLSSTVELDKDAFSALDWQKNVLQLCFGNYLRYPSELSSQLDKARYLHIPIGNMISYQPNSDLCCDLLFARHLYKHDHVMWCSGKQDPDLGGKETTDRRLMLLDDPASSLMTKDNPGMYMGVCIALELSYVPINTIIAMPKIYEMDGEITGIAGSGGLGGTLKNMLVDSNNNMNDDGGGGKDIGDPTSRNWNIGNSGACSNYDDTLAVSSAFRVLRGMLLGWVDDVSKFHNQIADELLVNLLRYLRSRQSLLYEPAITRTLMRLTSRLLCRLIDWLSGFGLKVVHASCSRLVLGTGKVKLEDAFVPIKQVQTTLRETEIFAALEMQFLGAWDLLLWRDSHNYSGVVSDLADLMSKPDNPSSLFLSQSSHKPHASSTPLYPTSSADHEQIDINWHVQRYIAPSNHPLQLSFNDVVHFYMSNIWKIIRDELMLLTNDNDSSATTTDVINLPSTKSRIEQFIQNDLMNFLFDKIGDLSNIRNKVSRSINLLWDGDKENDLPLLPLIKEEVEFPMGEFIKTICYILSFDQNCTSHLYGWKQNMLKLFKVNDCIESFCWSSPYSSHMAQHNAKEIALINSLKKTSLDQFSDETKERDLLVILPEMMCENCFAIRDLDLCRHENCVAVGTVTQSSTNTNSANSMTAWEFVCQSCGHALNRSTIESGLIDQINSQVESAVLQDMRCSKCHEIVETSLARADNCARCGHLINTTQDAEVSLQSKLRVYRDIGHRFRLDFIKSLVDTLLQEF